MGFIAAGLAVAAVGAGVSAYGTAKNAEAIGDANAANSANENDLYNRQSDMLNNLIKRKNNKLQNIGNIFDRFEGGGAFGDTDTLRNLRTAQQDFSALAAGDFSGFERQLQQSLQETLTSTQQSGAPVGTFAGLAADQQMQMRLTGLQSAMGISEFTSNESNKLLGMEFGIMDQKFNTNYELDRTRVSNMNNYALGQAATEGVGLTAYGNAAQQVGSSVASYGMWQENMGLQQTSLANQSAQIANMANTQSQARPTVNPYTNSWTAPTIPRTNTVTSIYDGSNVPIPNYNGLPDGQPLGAPFPVDTPAVQNFNQGLGPIYIKPTPASNANDGTVLPPVSYNSALSRVGMRIAGA